MCSLHDAVMYGSKEQVTTLISAGADKSLLINLLMMVSTVVLVPLHLPLPLMWAAWKASPSYFFIISSAMAILLLPAHSLARSPGAPSWLTDKKPVP